MFQTWRLHVQDATKALQCDRLEEALRLVEDHQLASFGPGKDLAAKIAVALIRRSNLRIEHGDRTGAWIDLDDARRLQGETENWLTTRERLVDRTIVEARIRAAAGEMNAAGGLLEEAARVHPASSLVQRWRQLLSKVEAARRREKLGRFAEAESQLHAALALEPSWEWLRDFRARVRERGMTIDLLLEKLNGLVTNQAWDDVSRVVDQITEIAPEHPTIMETRQKLRAARDPDFAAKHAAADELPNRNLRPIAASERTVVRTNAGETLNSGRFRLWIDGAGGYLICSSKRVEIGRAGPGATADIALFAELGSRHAAIERRTDAYVLIAREATTVRDAPVADERLLADGDEIQLGRAVRFRFRKPHPWSQTAKLEWLSRHRPQPAGDGVLLFADTIVLGRSQQAHLTRTTWNDEMVLFQQVDQLMFRSRLPFTIDGRRCEGRAAVPLGARVENDQIAWTIEKDDSIAIAPRPIDVDSASVPPA